MQKFLIPLLLMLLLPGAFAHAQCTASFLLSLPAVGSGAAPNTVYVTSTSTISTPSAVPVIGWNFGDGTTDTGAVVTHVYAAPGIYLLCITVFDPASGCSNQQCQTIQVGSTCTADFYPSTPFGLTVNLVGQLRDAAGNDVSSTAGFTWDFGDGTPPLSSLGQLTTHTYATGGTYLVTLTATNGTTACTGIYSDTLTLLPVVSGPCDPIFTWAESGLGQIFFSSNTTGSTTDAFDFGDGSTISNPGMHFQHVYPANGTYTACRYVTDTAANCTDSFCTQVLVQHYGGTPCYLYLGWQVNSQNLRQIDFDGLYVNLETNNMTPAGYFWDFGDGTTDSTSGELVSHVYAANGTYTVCLTAGDSSGCTNTYCAPVTTGGPTTCDVSFSGYETDPGQASFGFSQSGYTTDHWDFGDGSTDTTLNPLFPYHTYTANGFYTVCRTITDSVLGCNDSMCQTIEITMAGQAADPCNVTFAHSPDPANALTLQFISNHVNLHFPNTPVLQWKWDFGDGVQDSTSGSAVAHTFAQAGTYVVSLTATDSSGCLATLSLNAMVAGGTTYGIVEGQVMAGNTPLDYGMVQLVAVDAQTQMLQVIDSVLISPADSGTYFFNSIVTGFYTIKVIPATNAAAFTGYLPTYFGGVMSWNNAYFLFASPTQPYMAPISLLPVSTPSATGNGTITGTIWQGANKTGDATLEGIRVLLMDAAGNVVGYAVSDGSGNFTFSGLPAGTYTVYVDMLNRQMALFPITLDANTPSVNGVAVTVHSTGITVDIISGLAGSLAGATMSLSPNPVQETATLRMHLPEAALTAVTVRNALGQVILVTEQQLSTGENQVPLSLRDLPAGVYTVQIRANGQQAAVMRIVKQ